MHYTKLQYREDMRCFQIAEVWCIEDRVYIATHELPVDRQMAWAPSACQVACFDTTAFNKHAGVGAADTRVYSYATCYRGSPVGALYARAHAHLNWGGPTTGRV